MGKADRVASARAPFVEVVLVCGKCSKKLAKAGEARDWRGDLKRALKKGGWRRVRVIRSGCLDLCPKGRQVLASGRGVAAGRLAVLQPAAPVEGALTLLLGDAPAADVVAPSTVHAG